jgi:hypothetical protein
LLQSARHSAQPFVYGAIMETVREAWTDERMDDLVQHMDKSFDRFEKFEARMTSRFEWLWRLMLASYVTALIGYFVANS